MASVLYKKMQQAMRRRPSAEYYSVMELYNHDRRSSLDEAIDNFVASQNGDRPAEQERLSGQEWRWSKAGDGMPIFSSNKDFLYEQAKSRVSNFRVQATRVVEVNICPANEELTEDGIGIIQMFPEVRSVDEQ